MKISTKSINCNKLNSIRVTILIILFVRFKLFRFENITVRKIILWDRVTIDCFFMICCRHMLVSMIKMRFIIELWFIFGAQAQRNCSILLKIEFKNSKIEHF